MEAAKVLTEQNTIEALTVRIYALAERENTPTLVACEKVHGELLQGPVKELREWFRALGADWIKHTEAQARCFGFRRSYGRGQTRPDSQAAPAPANLKGGADGAKEIEIPKKRQPHQNRPYFDRVMNLPEWAYNEVPVDGKFRLPLAAMTRSHIDLHIEMLEKPAYTVLHKAEQWKAIRKKVKGKLTIGEAIEQDLFVSSELDFLRHL